MDSECEQWVDFKNDDVKGEYELSNTGKFRNKKTGHVSNASNIVRAVRLPMKDGGKKTFFIHILVANAFLHPDPSRPFVGFKDGDSQNCHVNNLFWTDKHEAQLRAVANGKRKRTTGRTVIKFDGNTKQMLQTYVSVRKAADDNGLKRLTLLGRIKRGSIIDGIGYTYAVQEFEEDEEWRQIPTERFTNYEASSQGRIRNKTTQYILSQWETPSGYLSVNIQCDVIFVHRLVAMAFLPHPPPPEKTQVNHMDMNKKNNCPDNLEWVTASENMHHARGRPVVQLTMDGKEVARFDSIRHAQHHTGIMEYTISKICKGVNHSAGGFLWKYAE